MKRAPTSWRVIDDDRAFYYIAEADESDDVEDPTCWIKANPASVASSSSRTCLRVERQEAHPARADGLHHQAT